MVCVWYVLQLLGKLREHLTTPMPATKQPPSFSTSKDKGTVYRHKAEPVVMKSMYNGIYFINLLAINNICKDPNDPSTHGDGN